MRRALPVITTLAVLAGWAGVASAAQVRIAVVPGSISRATVVTAGGARAAAAAGEASARVSAAPGSVIRIETANGAVRRAVGDADRQTLLVDGRGGAIRVVALDDPTSAGDRQLRLVGLAPGLAGATAGIHRSAQGLVRLPSRAPTAYLSLPAGAAACPALAVLDVRLRERLVGLPRIETAGLSATAVIYRYEPASMYPLDVMVLDDGAARAGEGMPFADDPSAPVVDAPRVAPGIRLFDAVPGSGPLRVLVDGRPHRLVYGQASPHLRAGPGAHVVVVERGGAAVASARVVLTAGRRSATAVVAATPDGGAEVAVFADAPPADADAARLRVIHAQPRAGAIAIAGGVRVARALSFLHASGYVAIPDRLARPCLGATYFDIERRGVLIKRSVLTLDRGNAYTAVLIRPHGTGSGAVKLVLLRDGR